MTRGWWEKPPEEDGSGIRSQPPFCCCPRILEQWPREGVVTSGGADRGCGWRLCPPGRRWWTPRPSSSFSSLSSSSAASSSSSSTLLRWQRNSESIIAIAAAPPPPPPPLPPLVGCSPPEMAGVLEDEEDEEDRLWSRAEEVGPRLSWGEGEGRDYCYTTLFKL